MSVPGGCVWRSCWWCHTGTLQPPRQWRPLLGILLCRVCALTVQLCSVEPGRSPGWGGGRLSERLSRDPWDLHGGGGQGARFPGSGFPLTPPGRSGLPRPRPRNVLLLFLSPPQGQAPGGRHSPTSLPGSPGGGQAGRTPGFLLPPIPKEIPPRSPQALGSQNNPAGEGRLRGREARGAQSRAAAAAGASGRGRGDKRAQGGAPTSPRSPGSAPSPGSPWALWRLRGWAGSLWASRFPNWWVAPSRARPFNPGVALADAAAPAQQGACPPRPVPAHRPLPRPAPPQTPTLPLPGQGSSPSPVGGSRSASWPSLPARRPWRAPSTWTRAARWRSCFAAASKPSVSGAGVHAQPEPGGTLTPDPLPGQALAPTPSAPHPASSSGRGPHAPERENVSFPSMSR